MSAYDIFNGDADGMFALRQLRLHEPVDAVLVTGVKRDITLIERVQASAGDRLTVLDISLAENRDSLVRALQAGAICTWFDHHFAGEIPRHPGLSAYIRCSPDTCTSLLVDEHLGGRYRAWAVAAAFGDNLPETARKLGRDAGLAEGQLDALEELGRLVNYNAYGAGVEELNFAPARLYERLSAFDDPLEFAQRDASMARLRQAYTEDLEHARRLKPHVDTPRHIALLLPDAPWSRRISGSFANELAQRNPDRASALLIRRGGGYSINIRAPMKRPMGADELARRFASGGGRSGAAGINALPEDELERFLREFRLAFDVP